jgi:hypothetical protein
MRHKSTIYIQCIHNKDIVQSINMHAHIKWSQQIYYSIHSLLKIIIHHETYKKYIA